MEGLICSPVHQLRYLRLKAYSFFWLSEGAYS
jgi:hypothetical protein